MTLAEKIIAAHADRESVEPGDLVNVRTDLVMANDVTAPIAIKEFQKIGAEHPFDPQRVVLVPDHFAPPKDISTAENIRMTREFARQHGAIFFELGDSGVAHNILPLRGLVAPGEMVVGGDSHTSTYGALGCFATGMGSTDIAAAMATGDIWMKVPATIKFVYRGKLPAWVTGKDLILSTIGDIGVDGARYMAMEFTGEAVSELSIYGRFTMTNMTIEAGGKVGFCLVDQKTIDFIAPRVKRDYRIYEPDEGAEYARIVEYDVSKLEPQIAYPSLPSNTHPVSEAVASNIAIDQVFIGSCTNAWIDDLRVVAKILDGRQVHPEVRCIIAPPAPEIWRQALKEGLIEIFANARAVIGPTTCGACFGGSLGVLAPGERAVSTTNRNFPGRMGSPESKVYLANPAVAAASAVMGRIAHPEEVIG
ncbi:MAG: 3-isopropylmalate dehydratase large subunit [Chloroflexi bacterium]|nr:3-isopropylmalate dehydratase large subunit [Chloroflexota bacterium]